MDKIKLKDQEPVSLEILPKLLNRKSWMKQSGKQVLKK